MRIKIMNLFTLVILMVLVVFGWYYINFKFLPSLITLTSVWYSLLAILISLLSVLVSFDVLFIKLCFGDHHIYNLLREINKQMNYRKRPNEWIFLVKLCLCRILGKTSLSMGKITILNYINASTAALLLAQHTYISTLVQGQDDQPYTISPFSIWYDLKNYLSNTTSLIKYKKNSLSIKKKYFIYFDYKLLTCDLRSQLKNEIKKEFRQTNTKIYCGYIKEKIDDFIYIDDMIVIVGQIDEREWAKIREIKESIRDAKNQTKMKHKCLSDTIKKIIAHFFKTKNHSFKNLHKTLINNRRKTRADLEKNLSKIKVNVSLHFNWDHLLLDDPRNPIYCYAEQKRILNKKEYTFKKIS